jgi:hypothetical protein
MPITSDQRRLLEIKKIPEARLLLRHAKLGLITATIGIFLLGIVIILHEVDLGSFPEYAWGGILSIPVTVLCMGIFTVFYEYYMRTTFVNSMRSMYWVWDTGVTVFPTHQHAPDRKDVLRRANSTARFMSTTFSRYFTDVRELVERKASQNVNFKFIIYDPESKAVEEKAREEGCEPEDFREEISSTCRRYLGPLTKQFQNGIQVRFCDFNTPFGITIIDDKEMVLSLNIYGLARSKNQTPCLIIENKYDEDAVFKLYENSFEAIWNKLDDRIPKSVKKYFESNIQIGEKAEVVNVKSLENTKGRKKT